jgi:hypothetical protein
MGSVVDMTGRVLEAGETVEHTRDEQLFAAALRTAFDDAPNYARYLAEELDLRYSDAACVVVTSLLQEAKQAAEDSQNELAIDLLESIGARFFGVESE